MANYNLLEDNEIPENYNFKKFIGWERKFSFDERNLLNKINGNYGNVYNLENGLVAKTFKNSPFIKNEKVFNDSSEALISTYLLEKNFKIAQGLFLGGVKVPSPYGLFLIQNNFTGDLKPAFVSEKIENEDLVNFPLREVEKIMNLFYFEIEKAEKLGFILGDDCKKLSNILYSKNKVFLTDFDFWSYKGDLFKEF